MNGRYRGRTEIESICPSCIAQNRDPGMLECTQIVDRSPRLQPGTRTHRTLVSAVNRMPARRAMLTSRSPVATDHDPLATDHMTAAAGQDGCDALHWLGPMHASEAAESSRKLDSHGSRFGQCTKADGLYFCAPSVTAVHGERRPATPANVVSGLNLRTDNRANPRGSDSWYHQCERIRGARRCCVPECTGWKRCLFRCSRRHNWKIGRVVRVCGEGGSRGKCTENGVPLR